MTSVKAEIIRNISNIPGWKTNRKIVVIESDDWGAVRTRCKKAHDVLSTAGLSLDKNHFDKYDTLESNEDLELLFDTLSTIKDRNGNNAVFTPMCIMGNPDFDKIIESNYSKYYFQPLEDTINDYPNSDRLLSLWREGVRNHVFIPEIHGREHLNVRRYMEILQHHEARKGMRISAQYKSFGTSSFKGIQYPNYLGALHPNKKNEIKKLHTYVLEAGQLFKKKLGYEPRVFIAPNSEEPKELESSLSTIGVRYLTHSKFRRYPLGDGNFSTEWNFMGKQNKIGQTYLNRNAFFEPALSTNGAKEYGMYSCLKEMSIAFRWKKPAVISTHRVNYVGSINEEIRDFGLRNLKELLQTALMKWPNIEFMSSAELGEAIKGSKKI